MSLNRLCAGCNQIVYPIEQLKCLDQVWHRGCFKCVVCRMPLSMTNYQGYDRKPYCKAHYPQPNKFTVIADTPEMQRVTANSKVISNAAYHHQTEKKATQDEMRKLQQYNYRDHIAGLTRNEIESVDPLPASNRGSMTHQQQHHNINNNVVNSNIKQPIANVAVISEPSTVQLQSAPHGTVFRALYSYQAKEDDEVTFTEGDLIIEGDPIDRGWMYGRVQRSGQWGMLPSNYVELIH